MVSWCSSDPRSLQQLVGKADERTKQVVRSGHNRTHHSLQVLKPKHHAILHSRATGNALHCVFYCCICESRFYRSQLRLLWPDLAVPFLVLLLLLDLTHLITQLHQACHSDATDCRVVWIRQKLVEKSSFWISPDGHCQFCSMWLQSEAHFVRSALPGRLSVQPYRI